MIHLKFIKKILTFRLITKKYGISAALIYFLSDFIRRITPFSIYKIHRINYESINFRYSTVPSGFSYKFMKAKEMRKYANDPDNDLSESFIKKAIENKEICLGIFHGEELASYTWYSDHPGHVKADVFYYFNNIDKYVQKGFTKIKFRGKGLLGFGLFLGCNEFTNRGYNALISLVEAHNLNPLRALKKLGAKVVGSIYSIMLFGDYYNFADRKAHKINSMFKKVSFQ